MDCSVFSVTPSPPSSTVGKACVGRRTTLYFPFSLFHVGQTKKCCIGLVFRLIISIFFDFSSMNIYLCALAVSDTTIILTAFFLFFIENVRHRSLFISKFFAVLAPITFPLGLTAQSLSVFLTVTAAVDCYILVNSSNDCKDRFCSTNSSLKVIFSANLCESFLSLCISLLFQSNWKNVNNRILQISYSS